MNVQTCRFSRYRLPLVRPITIAGLRIEHRAGVIITLCDDRGRLGYGEIAPLPGLHREDLDDVLAVLPQLKRMLAETPWPDKLGDLLGQMPARMPADMAPGIRCGMEMALIDLAGLTRDAPGGSIDVCALVMPGGGDLCDEVARLIEQGYRTVKIKVGRRSPGDDIAAIKQIQAAVGDSIRLRLDANRAWSLDDALRFCDGIDPANVEYIEEPVADKADQEAFCGRSPIRIALDETLAEMRPEELVQTADIAAMILKPAVLGGFSAASKWINRAAEGSLSAVISCCFESSIAVRAYAAFAAASGIADTAVGLDTLKFLAEDLLAGEPLIVDGKIDIGRFADVPLVFRRGLLEELKVVER